MAKSYTEQLNEWVRQRSQSARGDRNRVAFLAVRDDVSEALDQGWPVKTIWAHMVEQKRIGFGYDTFLVYVKRHVRHAAERVTTSGIDRPSAGSPASASQRASRPKAGGTRGSPGQAPHGQEPVAGFSFNAAPNREELI